MSGFVGRIVNVHDGDTITVEANLMPLLGVTGTVTHHVRLIGVNAPELNTAEGKVSQRWLSDLCLGKVCLVDLKRPDKYGGRIDADVWRAGDTASLSQQLVAAGMAQPSNP